jgi:hypothetical protein
MHLWYVLLKVSFHTAQTNTNRSGNKYKIRNVHVTVPRNVCRLCVFEKRVLRRIFGPRTDEVTGEWRRLHNEDLYALNSSLNIIRVIKSRTRRWAGHAAHMGERRDAYRMLVGKPEGKRSRSSRRR